jgi:NifB/MoaA-like Fe-S oxidoreductase
MEYQPDLKKITGNGGEIAELDAHGTGAAAGLEIGDIVVSVNGKRLRDAIDYRFYIADEYVELEVLRGEESLLFEIEKDEDDDLGIEFSEPLFDRLRTCNNKCPFCFLTQMPKGLRKTLYLKDDDYRLGFLYGNFVTFTNLNEDDWQRIDEQRLSPQYISVHATDRAARAVLLGKVDVPDVIDQIKRLGDMGIQVHAQIVAMPDINDGALLHQSIRELAAMYPIVRTIAVVPVGLTKYRFEGKRPQSIRTAIEIHEGPDWIDANWERQPLWDQAVKAEDLGFCSRLGAATDVPMRCYNADEAGRVVDIIEVYQKHFFKAHGTSLVYPSDEFYLLSGREMPPAKRYDGMPQYSNGVGMTRDFLDEWTKHAKKLPTAMPQPTELALLCATLIAPTLQGIVDRLNQVDNLQVKLVPVVNQFFGETVTVSGLLMGQDIVPVLKDCGMPRALLPRVMFDHKGEKTIDNMTLADISQASGVTCVMAGEPDEVVRYIKALTRAEAKVRA